MYAKTAKKKGMRVVFHVHGAEFDLFYSKCTRRQKRAIMTSFAAACRVIVLSESWKSFFCNELGLSNVVVLNNSVDCSLYEFSHGTPGSLSFVGQLGKRKGAYDLINALSQIKLRGFSFTCVFAGDGETKQVRELAEDCGLSDMVSFTGWVDSGRVRCLLRDSSIMVLPSYHEGFPMSIIEAMAAGNAVVSTWRGGIPEATCEDGRILIDAGDVDGLADALCLLLGNKQLVSDMTEANRTFVKTRLDNRIVHQALSDIYSEVLHENC